jgi:hypothetical protein
MTNQRLIDDLCVKFGIVNENVSNVKESIASGSLSDAIRAAKQLAYSANSFVYFLENLEVPAEAVKPLALK